MTYTCIHPRDYTYETHIARTNYAYNTLQCYTPTKRCFQHNLKLPIKLWTRAHTIDHHWVYLHSPHYIAGTTTNTLHYYLVCTKWHRRYTTKTLWHRKVLVSCCSALNYIFILNHAAITATIHARARAMKSQKSTCSKLKFLKNLFQYTIESILNPDVMLTVIVPTAQERNYYNPPMRLVVALLKLFYLLHNPHTCTLYR